MSVELSRETVPTRPLTFHGRTRWRWMLRRRSWGLLPLRRQLFHNRLKRMAPGLLDRTLEADWLKTDAEKYR